MLPAPALLFPGQGSQTREMRELTVRHWPRLVELATELVGADPFERVAEGTRFAQPAIFCASLAGWRALGGEVEPPAMAGHSLGELAALVAAGCIEPEVGLRLVVARGALMQEAGEPGTPGGMLAVSGPEADRAGDLLEGVDLVLANFNSPTQMVFSGPLGAVEEGLDRLRGSELRAVRLPVGGAFHSRLMEPAAAGLRAALAAAPLVAESSAIVICSTTCEPFSDIRRELVEGLTRPVRWWQTLAAIGARGVTRFAEVGPGRVLTRLLERAEGQALIAAGIGDG